MDNLKIGFYRNCKSKNAMHYPWLSRFNNDGTHVVNENPIEWKKETIKEFFTHIKLGTFGRNFTIADFMKSYKPVLFSKGKKKVDIFHLEFLDQTVEQFLKIKEERDEKDEILSIVQDQNPRAFSNADLYFAKRKVENYKDELEEKWVGTNVKHKDYGVVEIDSVNMLTEYWDDDYGVFESEVEFECHDEKSGDCITFDLDYAKKNLVEEEVSHG